MRESTEPNFDEVIEDTRWKLFNEFSNKEERPIGDDTGYVPPSHRWLPLVQEAAAKLAEAMALAEAEVPKHLRRELKMASLTSGDIGALLEQRGEPGMRRTNQIRTAAAFLQALVTELMNEGRPRGLRFFEKPEWKAHLAAVKRSGS